MLPDVITPGGLAVCYQMFTHPSNPPCFSEARKIETARIRQWVQEAYDGHP